MGRNQVASNGLDAIVLQMKGHPTNALWSSTDRGEDWYANPNVGGIPNTLTGGYYGTTWYVNGAFFSILLRDSSGNSVHSIHISEPKYDPGDLDSGTSGGDVHLLWKSDRVALFKELNQVEDKLDYYVEKPYTAYVSDSPPVEDTSVISHPDGKLREGELWYSTLTNELFIYDGAADWFPVAVDWQADITQLEIDVENRIKKTGDDVTGDLRLDGAGIVSKSNTNVYHRMSDAHYMKGRILVNANDGTTHIDLNPKATGTVMTVTGDHEAKGKLLVNRPKHASDAQNSFVINGQGTAADGGPTSMILKDYQYETGSGKKDYIEYFGRTNGDMMLQTKKSVQALIAGGGGEPFDPADFVSIKGDNMTGALTLYGGTETTQVINARSGVAGHLTYGGFSQQRLSWGSSKVWIKNASLDLTDNRIIKVGDPVDDTDAVNKQYAAYRADYVPLRGKNMTCVATGTVSNGPNNPDEYHGVYTAGSGNSINQWGGNWNVSIQIYSATGNGNDFYNFSFNEGNHILEIWNKHATRLWFKAAINHAYMQKDQFTVLRFEKVLYGAGDATTTGSDDLGEVNGSHLIFY